MLAIEGKLLPQKQIFGHESSSRLKSRPQELAEVRSETEENCIEISYPSHSSGILPNGRRYGNGKDSGSNAAHEPEKTAGFLHFTNPLLVFCAPQPPEPLADTHHHCGGHHRALR